LSNASAPLVLIVATRRGTGTPTVSALLPALGVPLLEHVLRAAERVASPPVAVLVGPEAETITATFAGRQLRFVRQDPACASGGEAAAAREILGEHETLLVLSGDCPLLRTETLRALLSDHEASGAAATVVSDGIVAFAVEPLRTLMADPQAGTVATRAAATLLSARGLPVRTFTPDDPQEVLAVSSLADLAGASRLLRDRHLAALLASGVLVEDPSSTIVGLDVLVEPGVHVRPFTVLEGRTVLRRGALVGPFARLVDCEIGPDAQILDHCFLRECVVEAGASVGPFAHLRPESRVGPRAKVGNFVELKKTYLGEGSKAPHLSYLGDATIGPGVNVGAGTITCNYDGTHKHPTRIDAGAFVGSNSTLVAPVVVGDGAYIAAGSTITEDVPPHSLALGRARQVVKPGWIRRKKDEKTVKG
jgi:bifunctional UDP-N-acetylglucosamine pyrophosphorylase/glucosamine-1-phosphate N-acetyltransferase